MDSETIQWLLANEHTQQPIMGGEEMKTWGCELQIAFNIERISFL